MYTWKLLPPPGRLLARSFNTVPGPESAWANLDMHRAQELYAAGRVGTSQGGGTGAHAVKSEESRAPSGKRLHGSERRARKDQPVPEWFANLRDIPKARRPRARPSHLCSSMPPWPAMAAPCSKSSPAPCSRCDRHLPCASAGFFLGTGILRKGCICMAAAALMAAAGQSAWSPTQRLSFTSMDSRMV